MFETIFTIIGIVLSFIFISEYIKELFYKKYYRGVIENINRVYDKVKDSDKEYYSKEDMQCILWLLGHRHYVEDRYFIKEN